METVIISESDQESWKYKENTYTDVELAQKPLDDVRKTTIEYVTEMGYKHQVRRHGAHPC